MRTETGESAMSIPVETVVAERLDRYCDIAVVLACLLLVVGLCAIASPDFIGNDGAQYVSTAEQILNGGGIRTTTVYYEVQAQFGMPANQTMWPPGVPGLLALLVTITGLSEIVAFSLMNTLAHASSVFILYRLLGHFFSGNKPVAAFVACLYLLYVWALNTIVGGNAEPLFTFFLMAGAGALFRAAQNPANKVGWWLLASSCVGMACAMRYIGVAFIGALGFIGLAELIRSNWAGAAWARVVALGAPATLIFSALIVRNLSLTGRMTGGPTNERGLTLAEYLLQTQWSITEVLGGGNGLAFRLGVLAFVITAAVFVFLKLRKLDAARLMASPARFNIAVFGVLGTILTVGLVYGLAATKSGLAVEGRYFITCVPLLIVGAAALWQQEPSNRAAQSAGKGTRWAFQAFAAASLLLTLVNASSFLNFVENGAAPRKIEQMLSVELHDQSITAMLKDAGSVDAPIMSNQSQALHMVLRKPTIGVPENRLTPTEWTPKLLVDLARQFGVEYLVVFKTMPMGWPDGSDDYVWQMVGNEPDSVSQLHTDDAIALYRINPPS